MSNSSSTRRSVRISARWPAVYHCPADYVLSQVQAAARWKYRVRSYSMNASVGDAGSVSASGYNINNPGYVQFFKLTAISRPSDIFVFLDEHPDSISDGYFVNQVNDPAYATAYRQAAPNSWLRLPASYHNGATSFSFADGHAEVAARVTVTHLRCEYRVNPEGIGELHPRLGWILQAEAGARGVRQTAYQIIVASSPELLAQGTGDLWDTGKVNSDQMQQIVYAGRTLAARQQCWWKARVWDEAGVEARGVPWRTGASARPRSRSAMTIRSDSALFTRGSFAPCTTRRGAVILAAELSGDCSSSIFFSSGFDMSPTRTSNIFFIGAQ